MSLFMVNQQFKLKNMIIGKHTYTHSYQSLFLKSSVFNTGGHSCSKPFNIFLLHFREDPNSFQKYPRTCVISGLSPSLSFFWHSPSYSLSSNFINLFFTAEPLHMLFPPPRAFSPHRCFYKTTFCLGG